LCVQTEHSTVGGLSAPGTLRRAVFDDLVARENLAQLPDLLANVLVVVSELTTNAVQAGSATVRVMITLHRRSLDIAVFDQAKGLPVVQPPSTASNHGRGLILVQAFSSAWGVERSGDTKKVWATLPIPIALTTQMTCHHPD
jgi:anti-sigma regulatory factor (Ser/Thr protein kinase)